MCCNSTPNMIVTLHFLSEDIVAFYVSYYRYKLAYSSNYSSILDPLIENNYQLFMVERLILSGATTFVKTFEEDESDLSLTDDPKKNTKKWQIPVYTLDGAGTRVSPYHLATSFSTILQKVRMF